jgi:hypothetical protein
MQDIEAKVVEILGYVIQDQDLGTDNELMADQDCMDCD